MAVTVKCEVSLSAEDDLGFDASSEVEICYEELQTALDTFIEDYADSFVAGITLQVKRLDD